MKLSMTLNYSGDPAATAQTAKDYEAAGVEIHVQNGLDVVAVCFKPFAYRFVVVVGTLPELPSARVAYPPACRRTERCVVDRTAVRTC